MVERRLLGDAGQAAALAHLADAVRDGELLHRGHQGEVVAALAVGAQHALVVGFDEHVAVGKKEGLVEAAGEQRQRAGRAQRLRSTTDSTL